jgi:hypothetical protein
MYVQTAAAGSFRGLFGQLGIGRVTTTWRTIRRVQRSGIAQWTRRSMIASLRRFATFRPRNVSYPISSRTLYRIRTERVVVVRWIARRLPGLLAVACLVRLGVQRDSSFAHGK